MADKVLIRTPNHLGDCIMSMPMVNETREVYPGAHITILTPKSFAELYENNPAVDEIIQIPNEYVHGLIAVMKVKDLISKYEFDIGYILPPSFGAAAGFKLAGVKERIGYIADGRRLLLTKGITLPAPLNAEHRSVLYFNLLKRSSNMKLEYVPPKLFLNDEDIKKGEAVLERFKFDSRVPYATIAFQAVGESRRWGQGNYLDLIKQLITRYNLKIVLVGGKEEQSAGDEIVNGTGKGKVVNLAGRTSLRESAAIISRSKFFVGNDSGGAHLAASVGTALVVLSGADDPKSTSPITSKKQLVYHQELECISCVKNKCPLKGDKFMQCMKLITVEQVLQKIENI